MMRPTLFALVSGLIAGCSMHSGTDEFENGLEESRAGLTAVDRGIAAYRSGDRASGMRDMERGLSKMSMSMGTMRDGVSMMPSGMMGKCCGDSTKMMGSLESALTELRAGHAMMVDADESNDAAGLARMDKAKMAAGDAMTTMSKAMSCM